MHGSLSLWQIFSGADLVVQLVIVGLLAASVRSWAIIFSKTFRLKRLKTMADRFEDAFWSGGPLEALHERFAKDLRDPFCVLFRTAMDEWKRSHQGSRTRQERSSGLVQRIERLMTLSLHREMDQLDHSIGFLASLGSAGTFVGLFGTVWGIMNSFQAIANAQTTSLTVVAPAISEALFATAIGLIAAIPAMLAYNKLSTEINRYQVRLEGFVQEFTALLSRKFEEGAA